jgi:thiol-disulfide isomerase/thioredoxin
MTKKFLKRTTYYSLLFVCTTFLIPEIQAQKKPKTNVSTNELSYEIKGVLLGKKPSKLYLKDGLNNKTIDSSSIDSDSVFSFRGKVNSSSLLYLMMDEQTAIPLAIDKNVALKMQVFLRNEGIQYQLEGNNSESTSKIRKFLEDNAKAQYNINSIVQLSRSGKITEDNVKEIENSYYMEMENQKALISNILSDTSNPLGAYFVFKYFVPEAGKEEYDQVLKSLKTIQKSEYYKQINEDYIREAATLIGGVAPDINLPSPQGDSIKLSSLRGKVVLIDFWASWCGPCRKENPFNRVMYEKFKNKGFEIYAVSLDKDKNSWVSAIEKDMLPWVHVSDLQYWSAAPAKVYKVKGIPATVLLDKEGKILAKNLRGEELEQFLDNYFRNQN